MSELNHDKITPIVDVEITYTRLEMANILGLDPKLLQSNVVAQNVANTLYANLEFFSSPDNKFDFNDSERETFNELREKILLVNVLPFD